MPEKKRTFIDNSQKLIAKYSAFVCLWGFRLCSILIAYSYNGYPGLIVLTLALLSIVLSLHHFVPFTVYIYMPYFIATFFWEYFANIQKLFMVCKNVVDHTGCKQDLTLGYYTEERTH
jgi:hypothetical protein